MTDQEIDVDTLRTELDQIKDAMGIRERNEEVLEFWLYFGVLTALAAALSQYVHLQRLPAWYHTVIWGGIIGGFFVVLSLGVLDEQPTYFGGEGKPDLSVLFVGVWLASIPIQVVFGDSNVYDGYVTASTRVLGLAIVLIGLAYFLSGNVLKAYYIRRRDRVPFYVGGLWMAVLGTAIPHVDVLRTWGYAVFGGCYLVYAVAVYVFLGGIGDE